MMPATILLSNILIARLDAYQHHMHRALEPRLQDMAIHGFQYPVLRACWEEDVKREDVQRTSVTLLYAYQDRDGICIDSPRTARS